MPGWFTCVGTPLTTTTTCGAAAVAAVQPDRDGVGRLGAVDEVLSDPRSSVVGAGRRQRVGAAEDRVVAGGVLDGVVAAVADQPVGEAAAAQVVVAGAAEQDVHLHRLVRADVDLGQVDDGELVGQTCSRCWRSAGQLRWPVAGPGRRSGPGRSRSGDRGCQRWPPPRSRDLGLDLVTLLHHPARGRAGRCTPAASRPRGGLGRPTSDRA